MTNHLLTSIYKGFDSRAAVARRHAGGGILSDVAKHLLYQRVPPTIAAHGKMSRKSPAASLRKIAIGKDGVACRWLALACPKDSASRPSPRSKGLY